MELLRYIPNPMLLLIVLGIIIVYFSVFVSISNIEKSFMSRELRLVRRSINEIGLFIAVFVLIIIFFPVLYSIKDSNLDNMLWVVVVTYIVLSLNRDYPNSKVLIYFYKRFGWIFPFFKKVILKSVILFIISIVHLILTFLIYGNVFNSILSDINLKRDLKQTNLLGVITNISTDSAFLISFFISMIIFYVVVLRLLVSPVIFLAKKSYNQEIKVNVTLISGKVFDDYYLIHPTYGKRILIGDYPKLKDCTKQVAINNDKIEYIEFTTTFNILGRRRSSHSKLLQIK